MYRFTDGTIHDIEDVDFFEKKFSKISVIEENFEKEKSKWLYQFTELPYPKDLEMIKFRYYTDDNQLIEQENVPVVYDGSGIEKIENQYLLTNKDSGIIGTETGWTSETQTPTIQNRYVWKKEITYLSNKTKLESKPTILSMFVQGERGSKYLGSFTSNAFNEPIGVTEEIVGMDFYLSKTSKTIYQKVGSEWVERKYTGYESLYKQAIGDCMELAKESGEASYAAVAFITNLFAENILVTGSMRVGERYADDGRVIDETKAGVYLSRGGTLKANKAELSNVNVSGDISANKFFIKSPNPDDSLYTHPFISELNDIISLQNKNFLQTTTKGFVSIAEGYFNLYIEVYSSFNYVSSAKVTIELYITGATGGHKTIKKEILDNVMQSTTLFSYNDNVKIAVGETIKLSVSLSGATSNLLDHVRVMFIANADSNIVGALKALSVYKEFT